jgi:hypothetical protein
MAFQSFSLFPLSTENGFQYIGPTSFPQGGMMAPQYIQGLPLAPPHFGGPANVFMVENTTYLSPQSQDPGLYISTPFTAMPPKLPDQTWQLAAAEFLETQALAPSSAASSAPGILSAASTPSHDFLHIPIKTPPPKVAPVLPKSARPKMCFATSRCKKNNKPVIVPPPAPGDTSGEGPRQLIVNYLPQEVDSAMLRELFEPYGPIVEARLARDPETKGSRGFGFVYFRRHADAVAAIADASGRVLRGKRVRVSYAVPQRELDTA